MIATEGLSHEEKMLILTGFPAKDPVVRQVLASMIGKSYPGILVKVTTAVETQQVLSCRELEVLAHVAHGLTNHEIANVLSTSDNTVKNQVTSILRKLGAVDRTTAVVTGLRRGYLHF